MRVAYAWWLWVACAVCAGLAVCLRKRRRLAFCLLLLACFALGLSRGGISARVPDMPTPGKWSVEGTIDGTVRRNDRAVMLYLRDVQVQLDGEDDWILMEGLLYCYCPTTTQTAYAHGERISLRGTSYLPSVARNPGGFDQKTWLLQSGAHMRLYASTVPRKIGSAAWSLRGMALSVNAALGARMDALFGLASPVVRAMLLGDQTQMPEEWSDWMRDSGIAHLLAVSGLHVALWYGLLSLLLKPFPLSPKLRLILLGVLLAGYALLTGLKASVLRAVLMLLMMEGSHVAQRKADPLTTIALAAGLILLFRPMDLFSAGFQLSFSAVLGIALLGAPLRRLLPIPHKGLQDGLVTMIAAQVGILPAASHWFAGTALLSALSNLVAVPLTGLLIPVAALATLLDAVWTPLGFLFVEASRGMVAILMLLARVATLVPFGFAKVGAFAWWTTAAFFVCMLLCSSAVIWRWRTRILSMVVAIAMGVGIGFFSGSFWVRYVQLDVGQALSGVLHVGSGCYVYDTGDEQSDLTEYLLYTGSDVDGLILSHPHRDHVGGLGELLEAGIDVRRIYVPAQAQAFGGDPQYADYMAQAAARGAEIIEVAAGDVLDLHGLVATVVAPEREVTRGNDPNDRSIVLSVEIGEYLLLLMGDADGAAEPLGVDTDVLQVAHHGSRNAARTAFLADATPDIALVSTGRNAYGHPNEETIQRLLDAGAQVYITQETGAITLYFRPKDIVVEAYIR